MATIAGGVKHINGAANTTAADVNLGVGVNSITIENMDATNNLLVSFDGGATFKTLGIGKSVSLEVSVGKIMVKSSAGSVNYEILATIR